MRFKGILFDLDGTLINTNQLILETFDYTLNKILGLQVPHSELIKTFGQPLSEVMRNFDADKEELLLTTYRTYNAAIHDQWVTPFPQAAETLTQLKAMGIKLAVVTSKKGDVARHGLEFCRLENYFDAFITPEDTLKHKPEPEPALKALEKLNLAAKDSLMVGDSPYDLLCGARAGCKTAAVRYSLHDKTVLAAQNPDYWLDSLADLIAIVSQSC